MRHRQLFDILTRDPVVLGAGLVALDVVISDRDQRVVRLCAGGTCGNVLAILSYMGWDAYPVARLNGDPASQLVLADLIRWGVRRDFANVWPTTRTPIVVHRIRQDASGAASHSFSQKCPECEGWLPGYRALPASSLAEITLQIIHPRVFFLDRVSSGTLALAKSNAENGAIIFFEPSSVGDERLFRQAIGLTHVLKYSRERLGNADDLSSIPGPILCIETMDADGLRYQSYDATGQSRGWRHLRPYEIKQVRDTAGAGDWLTAGTIHLVGQMGLEALRCATTLQLEEVLSFGQALAAWNCGFEGARGGMYGIDRATLQAEVEGIMSGRESTVTGRTGPAVVAREALQRICPTCSSKQRASKAPEPKVLA